MALKMKDSVDQHSESGQGSHTQESGDECLSANLVQYYSDTYEEILTNSDQPKQHSSVTLILNEKVTQFELSPTDEKVPLSVDFGPESQKVSSEEDTTSLDPMMPQNPTCSTNTMQEQEAAEPTPEISSFLTVEEEITVDEDDYLNMEDGENPAEAEPVDQQRGRNNDERRTFRVPMAKKKRILVGVIIASAIIAGSIGAQRLNSGSNNNGSISSGAPKPNSGPDIGSASYCPGNCFTCTEEGKCRNMTTIFRNLNDEDPVYQRNKTQPFPKCSEMKAPKNDTCSVCFDRDAIRICCSNITEIIVEDHSRGDIIKNIQNECKFPPTLGPAGN